MGNRFRFLHTTFLFFTSMIYVQYDNFDILMCDV